MRKIAYTLAMLAIIPVISYADVPQSQRDEVEHLIYFVRDSGCLIERNGVKHSGAKAVEHIRTKYAYFRDTIKNTEDFIDYSASKSTTSGKPYLVYCPGMKEIPAGEWLYKELKAFRSTRNEGELSR